VLKITMSFHCVERAKALNSVYSSALPSHIWREAL
jgi:hypothetical protein